MKDEIFYKVMDFISILGGIMQNVTPLPLRKTLKNVHKKPTIVQNVALSAKSYPILSNLICLSRAMAIPETEMPQTPETTQTNSHHIPITIVRPGKKT